MTEDLVTENQSIPYHIRNEKKSDDTSASTLYPPISN